MTPEHKAHCEEIIRRFASDFRAKYERGQVEHGGDLAKKSGMLDFAIEEVTDLVAYLYTERDQRAFRATSCGALPRVVYVAGPFRGPNAWEIEQNIRRAEALALEVWRLGGVAVVCPHTNTRFFQGAADDAVWLDGDLAMLARCDAVMLTADWSRSSGATVEREFAQKSGIPVFESLAGLATWLNARHSLDTVTREL